jgi:hypothetical protein
MSVDVRGQLKWAGNQEGQCSELALQGKSIDELYTGVNTVQQTGKSMEDNGTSPAAYSTLFVRKTLIGLVELTDWLEAVVA